MTMIANVDAGVRGSVSAHAYVLYREDTIPYQKSFWGNVTDSIEAEIMSIVVLLMDCKKKKLNHVTIKTDCKTIVQLQENHKKKWHKKYGKQLHKICSLLEEIKGSIVWIKREENSYADSLCRKLFESSIDESNNSGTIAYQQEIKLLSERVLKNSLSIVSISLDDKVSTDHMWQYYSSMVHKNKRKSIEDILKWSQETPSRKGEKGRRYIVESFISEFHAKQDVNPVKAKHAFAL